MTVVVRARRPSDVAACLEIAQETSRVDGYPARKPKNLAAFLIPPSEVAAWVAETDGAVAGHVALHHDGAPEVLAVARAATGARDAELVVLARLFVTGAHRRLGIGRTLVATAVEEAHRRGQLPILDVAQHFPHAVALYESCGWRRAGPVTLHVGESTLESFVYIRPRKTA